MIYLANNGERSLMNKKMGNSMIGIEERKEET